MAPVTVGIDARAAAEVPAGRGRYVRELLTALAARDDGDRVRYRLFARERWGELDPERFTWDLVGLPDPAWHVATAARARGRCDVYVSTNSYLTAWFLRVPSVIVVYDLVPFIAGTRANRRAALIEKATIRPALRRARALVCISDSTRDDLVRLFPATAGRAHAIPLAAHPRFAAAHAAPAERPYVLSVGSLEPRKNLPRLVRAWASLTEAERAGHELALVGPKGWEGEELEAELAARPPAVRLLGYVSDDELAGLYAGATAFAYPALYEGFGLPVLEAMAAGAPVLTSDVSSLPEVAGGAALLVDPLSERSIADGLRALLGDPARRDAMRARGRERAAGFGWDRTAAATLEIVIAAAQAASARA